MKTHIQEARLHVKDAVQAERLDADQLGDVHLGVLRLDDGHRLVDALVQHAHGLTAKSPLGLGLRNYLMAGGVCDSGKAHQADNAVWSGGNWQLIFL